MLPLPSLSELVISYYFLKYDQSLASNCKHNNNNNKLLKDKKMKLALHMLTSDNEPRQPSASSVIRPVFSKQLAMRIDARVEHTERKSKLSIYINKISVYIARLPKFQTRKKNTTDKLNMHSIFQHIICQTDDYPCYIRSEGYLPLSSTPAWKVSLLVPSLAIPTSLVATPVTI